MGMPKYYRKTFKLGLIFLVFWAVMSASLARAQYPWTPLFERKVESINGTYEHLAFCSGFLKWMSQQVNKQGMGAGAKRIFAHSQWMADGALQFALDESLFLILDKIENWDHEKEDFALEKIKGSGIPSNMYGLPSVAAEIGPYIDNIIAGGFEQGPLWMESNNLGGLSDSSDFFSKCVKLATLKGPYGGFMRKEAEKLFDKQKN